MNKYKNYSRERKKEKKRFKMCESKVRYDTELAASRQTGMKVYKCLFCNGYHRSASQAKLVAKVKAIDKLGDKT